MASKKIKKSLLIAASAFISLPLTSMASDVKSVQRRDFKPRYNSKMDNKKMDARIGKRSAKVPANNINPKSNPGKRIERKSK